MPNTFYNENDHRTATWLRELVKQGCIRDGEVDERSIEEITPADLVGYERCHFFAGIGGWDLALEQAGWPANVPVWTGSCPCQPFSQAGKRKGIDDERHLWPSFFWLICQYRPQFVFGEQVAGKAGEAWLDIVSTDLENEGYAVGSAVTAACGFGAPHMRKRIYWVAKSSDSGVWNFNGSSGDENGRALDSGTEGIRQRDGADVSGWASTGKPIDDLGDSKGEPNRPLDGERRKGDGPEEQNRGSSVSGRLGDSDSGIQEKKREIRQSTGTESTRGTTDRLADPECDEQRERGISREDGGKGNDSGTESSLRGNTIRLAHNNNKGFETREQEELPGTQRDDEGRATEQCSGPLDERLPSETNGFWADPDWLGCRDGKWRPTKPGIQPLAHGVPGRVGALRGYGNAIVVEQAKAFIESFIEVMGQEGVNK